MEKKIEMEHYELNVKSLYLQDLIELKNDGILNYRKWLKNTFKINAIDRGDEIG